MDHHNLLQKRREILKRSATRDRSAGSDCFLRMIYAARIGVAIRIGALKGEFFCGTRSGRRGLRNAFASSLSADGMMVAATPDAISAVASAFATFVSEA
jgi:hypothetical protein